MSNILHFQQLESSPRGCLGTAAVSRLCVVWKKLQWTTWVWTGCARAWCGVCWAQWNGWTAHGGKSSPLPKLLCFWVFVCLGRIRKMSGPAAALLRVLGTCTPGMLLIMSWNKWHKCLSATGTSKSNRLEKGESLGEGWQIKTIQTH